MSAYSYQRQLLDAATKAAGRRVFLLDTDRWNSMAMQGYRSGAAPATLTLHLDASEFSSPDENEATGSPGEWILDYVASVDLAAAAQVHLLLPPTLYLPRWIRARIEHTGVATEYQIEMAAKGDAAGA